LPVGSFHAPQSRFSPCESRLGFVKNDIYSRNGEQLGTIKDVLVGPDGRTAAAIINVGRYLGIGDKEIAVPFSALQVE